MGGEVFQAQILKNFFDTITGTDRNLTRIYMCVISLAKLRLEARRRSHAGKARDSMAAAAAR